MIAPRSRAATLALTTTLLLVSMRAEADESIVTAEPAPSASTAPEPEVDLKSTRKTIYATGGIMLGVGSALLALGVFGAFSVRQRYDEAALGCTHVDPAWGCSQTAIVEMEDARLDSMGVITALGHGAAASLIGTILLATAHTAELSFRVDPSTDGLALSVGGVF